MKRTATEGLSENDIITTSYKPSVAIKQQICVILPCDTSEPVGIHD